MVLSEKIIEEIVANSNHPSAESVQEAIYTGDIEIYVNQDAYFEAGYDDTYEENCIVLKNGYIVYFIGG